MIRPARKTELQAEKARQRQLKQESSDWADREKARNQKEI